MTLITRRIWIVCYRRVELHNLLIFRYNDIIIIPGNLQALSSIDYKCIISKVALLVKLWFFSYCQYRYSSTFPQIKKTYQCTHIQDILQQMYVHDFRITFEHHVDKRMSSKSIKLLSTGLTITSAKQERED